MERGAARLVLYRLEGCTGVPRPETSADDGTSDASDSRSHSRRRDESNESTETTDGAEATWTDETDDAEATTNCDDATERDDDEQLRASSSSFAAFALFGLRIERSGAR